MIRECRFHWRVVGSRSETRHELPAVAEARQLKAIERKKSQFTADLRGWQSDWIGLTHETDRRHFPPCPTRT